MWLDKRDSLDAVPDLVLRHGLIIRSLSQCIYIRMQFSNDCKTSDIGGSLSTVYNDGEISTCG